MRHRGERRGDMDREERRLGMVIAMGVGLGVLVLLVGLFLIIALT